jgi:hypothetical protein
MEEAGDDDMQMDTSMDGGAMSTSMDLALIPATPPHPYVYLDHTTPFPFSTLADPAFADRGDGYLYAHYMQQVLPAMYLLADRSIDTFIRKLATRNMTLRNAMCFVASSHWHSKQIGTGSGRGSPASNTSTSSASPPSLVRPLTLLGSPDDTTTTYRRETESMLAQSRQCGTLTEGEALASLMGVSSFLFSGGRGEWQWFLGVACDYVRRVLMAPTDASSSSNGVISGPTSMFGGAGTDMSVSLRPSYAEVLRRSDDTVRFIVRATMWFEVLASVTEVRKPQFMDVYRELFNAARFTVVDEDVNGHGSSNGNANNGNGLDNLSKTPIEDDLASTTANGFSMLSIMGCDNRTFLAIAEISEFAAWKEEELRKGRLSVPELVMRGKQLEEQFFPRGGMGVFGGDALDGDAFALDGDAFSFGAAGSEDSTMSEAALASPKVRRSYTARIFRAAAKLYLHTIISDDQPLCSEIEDGVHEVIRALKRSPLLVQNPSSEVAGSIVRSVVFPICIAGSMSDKKEEQEYLSSLLESQSEAGNCAEVLKAMRSVWDQRRRRQTQHRGRHAGRAATMVSWRDVVQQNGLLLLV